MLNVVLFADIKPSVLFEMFQNHDPFRRQTALNIPSIATIFRAASHQSQSNLTARQTFHAADRLLGFPLSDFFSEITIQDRWVAIFFSSVRFLINSTVSVKRDLWVVAPNFTLKCCYVNLAVFSYRGWQKTFFKISSLLNYVLSVRKSSVLYWCLRLPVCLLWWDQTGMHSMSVKQHDWWHHAWQRRPDPMQAFSEVEHSKDKTLFISKM